MKNDLTCAVVRDLLPSYVEGLTSEETDRAVDAHLAQCADCTAQKEAMTAPKTAAEQGANAEEVDYLKKVRRRNGRRVAVAAVCTALVILAGLALKTFVIGVPPQADEVSVGYTLVDEGFVLHLGVDCYYAPHALRDWEMESRDGVVTFSAKRVTASPLFPAGQTKLEVPLDGVEEVWVCGRLAWQDGVGFGGARDLAVDLYNARTAYVGDAPALGRIAELLQIEDKCGLFTHELQTASEPYGWTLNFTASMIKGRAWYLDLAMEDMAPLMLALVDNLGEVSWTYTDTQGEFHTHTVTVEDADAYIRQRYERLQELGVPDLVLLDSVKDYSTSPANLQRLRDILALD